MGNIDDRCMSCGGPRARDELGYICDGCARRYGLLECECPHMRTWYCGCAADCPQVRTCPGWPLLGVMAEAPRASEGTPERSEP